MNSEEFVPKLMRPTDETIERLATDPTVNANDVREVLSSIEGLSFEEALAFVDIMGSKRKWSLDTLLAIMEGIDDARMMTN